MAQRPRHPVPDDVTAALLAARLQTDYDARPAYQRNDYVAWISRAKTAPTRARRIARMVEELALGGVYMGMSHAPSRKDRSPA